MFFWPHTSCRFLQKIWLVAQWSFWPFYMKRFQKLFLFPMGVPSSCLLIWIIVFFVVFLFWDKEIERKTTKFSPLGRTPLSNHGFLLKHGSAFCYNQFLKTLTQVVFSTKIVGFINVLFIYLFIFLILSICLCIYQLPCQFTSQCICWSLKLFIYRSISRSI